MASTASRLAHPRGRALAPRSIAASSSWPHASPLLRSHAPAAANAAFCVAPLPPSLAASVALHQRSLAQQQDAFPAVGPHVRWAFGDVAVGGGVEQGTRSSHDAAGLEGRTASEAPTASACAPQVEAVANSLTSAVQHVQSCAALLASHVFSTHITASMFGGDRTSGQSLDSATATRAPSPAGFCKDSHGSLLLPDGRVTRAAPSDPAEPVLLHSTNATALPCQPAPSPAAAALIFCAAASLAYACSVLWRRWQRMRQRQAELQQVIAANQLHLARQKQRFQRALVVDSIALELPAIKESDVQPGSVRVEDVLERRIMPQRSAPAPSQQPTPAAVDTRSTRTHPIAANDSLRQWQHFMAASRAREVKGVSGYRSASAGSLGSGRGRPAGADDAAGHRPFGAMDESALDDLSNRIRRAEDPSASGAAAAGAEPAPAVTFEQLYADSRESDEQAMARRAAERKARWLQSHELQARQAASGTGRAHVGGAPAAGQSQHANSSARTRAAVPSAVPGRPQSASPPASAPAGTRSSTHNPFAAGLPVARATAVVGKRPTEAAGAPRGGAVDDGGSSGTLPLSRASCPAAAGEDDAPGVDCRSHEPSLLADETGVQQQGDADAAGTPCLDQALRRDLHGVVAAVDECVPGQAPTPPPLPRQVDASGGARSSRRAPPTGELRVGDPPTTLARLMRRPTAPPAARG